MLEELIPIHHQVLASTPQTFSRYLYDRINWSAVSICVYGARGVGKTTLMCQYLLKHFPSVETGLYISADNVNVLGQGLFKVAQNFFNYGGKALIIDEVHKYPHWALELKNIIDTYRDRQIIFSASSALDLLHGKTDLSRRVVYYELHGLSFREFLQFESGKNYNIYTLEEILTNSIAISKQFVNSNILKFFKDYLEYGYYPFYLESKSDYLSKLNNIIEKIIFEDIAVMFNLKQTTLPIFKKLIWLVATSPSFTVNIENLSKTLQVSREIIYNCLDYLDRTGLFNNVFSSARGLKLIRKPEKLYLNNTNLLHAINGSLRIITDKGMVHETFFVNQLRQQHRINVHNQGDFIIDEKIVIEIGGKGKNFKQLKNNLENSYLALDNIEIGLAKKIPLYLFGFLY